MNKVILGQKIILGEKKVAPKNPTVLAYLKAAQEGKGLAKKLLKKA